MCVVVVFSLVVCRLCVTTKKKLQEGREIEEEEDKKFPLLPSFVSALTLHTYTHTDKKKCMISKIKSLRARRSR